MIDDATFASMMASIAAGIIAVRGDHNDLWTHELPSEGKAIRATVLLEAKAYATEIVEMAVAHVHEQVAKQDAAKAAAPAPPKILLPHGGSVPGAVVDQIIKSKGKGS